MPDEKKLCGHVGLAIVQRPIAELKLDQTNPRLHSPRQVKQIARSIATLGFNVPVLVDAKLTVIAGHGRFGLPRAGASGSPDNSGSTSQPRAGPRVHACRQSPDRNSVLDDRLLAQQLKELSELNLDFSLEAIGFEMGEIDLRIEGLTAEETQERSSRCTTADDDRSGGESRPATCGYLVHIGSFAGVRWRRARMPR